MINLIVEKNVINGANIYTFNPEKIIIGNETSHNANEIKFELPTEWNGLTRL